MDATLQFLSFRFVQAIILTAITIFVAQVFIATGKLRWSMRHTHWFKLPKKANDGSDIDIVTTELWFNNIGRAPVEDIEIVFNWKPLHFEIWNPREHSETLLQDGRFILKIPSLAAKEFFSVSLLDTRELPRVVNVRSKNSSAKDIAMAPMRIFPTWFNVLGLVLMLLGLGTAFYLVLWVASPLWSLFPEWKVG